MKSVNRATVLVTCLIAVALSSHCGGNSQPSAPPLVIGPASLPSAIVGTPYSQPLNANGGVAPYDWGVSTGNLPHDLLLEASGSTATISGTPDTAAQGVNFTIQVTDSAQKSASQPYTVPVLLGGDAVTFSSPSLDFRGQLVGTASTPQAVTVTNGSISSLIISGIAMGGNNGSDFVQNTTCGSSLASGANCMIGEVFTPRQVGPRSAFITLTDDAPGSPQSVPLGGVGLVSGANATLSATSIPFGPVAVGETSEAQSVTLNNYGTSALNITSIAASASFTETDNCGAALASTAGCTINITFSPTATGIVSGTLMVSYTGPGSPQTVSLSGSGVAGSCYSRGQYCSSARRCCPGLQCVLIHPGLNVYTHACEYQ